MFMFIYIVYLEYLWDCCKLILLYTYVVEVDREKGFHLDVEDYLAGVLILASELVSVFTFQIYSMLSVVFIFNLILCFSFFGQWITHLHV